VSETTAAPAVKAVKKEKINAVSKHVPSLPKMYKLMNALIPDKNVDVSVKPEKGETKIKGLSHTPKRGNPMLEAHQEYELWRKQGFKGAWWWIHAKGAQE
jgi:hypothetical protein